MSDWQVNVIIGGVFLIMYGVFRIVDQLNRITKVLDGIHENTLDVEKLKRDRGW